MNSVVVLSQNLWPALTFILGDKAQCWSTLCGSLVAASSWWSAAHGLSLEAGRSACFLSCLAERSQRPMVQLRAVLGPTSLLSVASSSVPATAYVLLKGREEGRQEVRYMGMLKNLKMENLPLNAKCLWALAFRQFQLNPHRDIWVGKWEMQKNQDSLLGGSVSKI